MSIRTQLHAGLETEIAWLEQHSAQVQEAKDIIKAYGKIEKSVKAWLKENNVNTDAELVSPTGQIVARIDTRAASGHSYEVNARLVHALMTNANLVNGRRDRLRSMFKVTYASTNGSAVAVRDEADEFVVELQHEGFAGEQRVTEPEPAFLQKENAATVSYSLKV